jgi:DNA invertase Pin-like site-specific DNA recombinase
MASKRAPKAEPRAAIYCRISQDRTGDELGVDRQREDCEKLARDRGWQVVAVFTDDDRSAFSGRPRPGYDQLLAALKSGDVTAVAAWHPDRLHRSPKELEAFIDLVEASRAHVATVTAGELDLSTASGRMTARVVGAVARHESEHKSERLRRQREQAALAGKPHGGKRAFGYDDSGTRIVKCEAATIREAAKRVLAGEPLKAVARDLNRRGRFTSTGREWTMQTLRQTLMAPRLAGLRVHRGDVIGPGVWPAILSRDDHDLLRALFAARMRRGRPPTSLLGGLMVCGVCGATMQQSASRRDYRRYACHSAPGRAGCGGNTIRADHTEELVTEVVLQRLDTPMLVKAMNAVDDAPANEVSVLEARLAELAETYAVGEITKAEWMRARSTIDQRLEHARIEVGHATRLAVVDEYREPGVLRDAWPRLSTDEKRSIIASVVTRIVIAPAEKRARWDADRITITWRA